MLQISNEMMTLIGLLVTVVVVMGGALLAIGRYQRQVDDNTTDIENEKKDRKESVDELKELIREDRLSSFKRDSDLQKDIRRCDEDCKKEIDRFERRVAEVELAQERAKDAADKIIPIKKKDA